MDSEQKEFTLNNGLNMPKVGLGTYLLETKKPLYDAIVKAGYRHLDTAYLYDNEEVIGDTLKDVFKDTQIKREDLFITTKLW